MTPFDDGGFTLLEAIVIVAIIGLAAALTAPLWSGGSAEFQRFARFVAATRMAAVAGGTAIGIGETPCAAAGSVVAPATGARLMAMPSRGLVFGADGLPRPGDGGGVGNTTILLEHRGRRAAVIVSSLGRVRWEPR